MTSTGDQAHPDWREALKEPEGFKASAQPGILHHYSAKLTAFEHQPPHSNAYKPHALIFIAGLGDGLLTVPFIPPLAEALAPTNWSVFSLLLSSSYSGWGIRGLSEDCDEIAKCVSYVREWKKSSRPDDWEGGEAKVVLMGHSTGSQDVLHYVVYDMRVSPAVDGALLQAPVSDREGMTIEIENGGEDAGDMYQKAMGEAKRLWQRHDDQGDDEGPKALMPIEMTRPFYGNTPMTAERWLSLQAKGYDYPVFVDDLFSSDVDEQQLRETWGRISKGVHLCVLYSGSDEHVPGWVDKKELIETWKNAVRQWSKAAWDDDNSGIIEGARHAMDGEGQVEQRKELVRRVMRFMRKVERDGKSEKRRTKSRTKSQSSALSGNEMDINFD